MLAVIYRLASRYGSLSNTISNLAVLIALSAAFPGMEGEWARATAAKIVFAADYAAWAWTQAVRQL